MNSKTLSMIAVVIAAACCFSGSALAVDSVILRGGEMAFQVSLGMSEQELVREIGAPDILKNNGTCYQYRLFDASIMLDDERRVEEIYAGRNFAGAVIRDDGSEVSLAADAWAQEPPIEYIFREFGEPIEVLRRAYAPSTDLAGAVTRETEDVPSSAPEAAKELPAEYRGDRVLYQLYNGPGVIKYKYVLDKSGIAFWLDADKTPYATVIYRPAPVEQPAAAPAEEPEPPLIVYFDFDRDVIKTDYVGLLEAQAQRLQDNADLCAVIEGHADEKGTGPYNDELSMRRARTVIDFLSTRGVSAERMTAAAFGERVPAAANRTPDGRDNPEGRALNRRVLITTIECKQ